MNGLADDGLILAAGPLAGTESGSIRVLLIADADHEAEIVQRSLPTHGNARAESRRQRSNPGRSSSARSHRLPSNTEGQEETASR